MSSHFDPSLLGANFRFLDRVVTGGAAAVSLCDPSPYRVALILSTGAAPLVVRPINPPGGGAGVTIPTSQPFLLLSMSQFGTLVQQQWWLATGAGAVYVLEVLWQPEGGIVL